MWNKNDIYFADFETLTFESKQYQEQKHTDVWMWALTKDGENVEIGNTLSEFMKRLFSDYKTKLVYFHNLSFDGNFIEKWLFKNLPTWFKCDTYNQGKKHNYFQVFKRGGTYYYIDINARKYDNKTGKKKDFHIRFQCTRNLLSTSIEALGKSLGIDKHSGEDLQKLIELGYIKQQKDFYHLGGDYLFKEKGLVFDMFCSYIKRDVIIAYKAFNSFKNNIEVQQEAKNTKYHKQSVNVINILTVASLTSKMTTNYLYNSKQTTNKETNEMRYSPNKAFYELSQMFYSGGISQFNPDFQNEVFEVEGVYIDINSSYPFSMTKLLPYGDFLSEKPEGEYLEYVIVDMEFNIKPKWDNVVCMRKPKEIKTNFYRYLRVGKGRYYFLKEEFELMKKFYNIKVINQTTYYTKAKAWLKPYIEKYYQMRQQAKMNKDKALDQTFKIFLNSLYGSFAKKAYYPSTIYVDKKTYDNAKNQDILSYEGVNWRVETKKQTQHIKELDLWALDCYDIEKLDNPKKKYPNLLVGATITAWSRIKLLEAIYEIGAQNFLYCDTDSVFFKWKHNKPLPTSIEIDETKLGAWKVENTFSKIKILGSKRYVVEDENKNIKVAACGVDTSIIKHFEEADQILTNGFEIDSGKLFKQEDDYGILLMEKNIVIKSGKL